MSQHDANCPKRGPPTGQICPGCLAEMRKDARDKEAGGLVGGREIMDRFSYRIVVDKKTRDYLRNLGLI